MAALRQSTNCPGQSFFYFFLNPGATGLYCDRIAWLLVIVPQLDLRYEVEN